MRRLGIVIAVILAFAAPAAQAAIVFTNLGTNSPPSMLTIAPVTALDTTPQAAIVDGTPTGSIPATPLTGNLTFSQNLRKETVPSTWATWSNGYTGPVFEYNTDPTTVTITLPAGSTAFYAYVEPDNFGAYNVTAVTNTGVSSGAISVTGDSGANGFGFNTTDTAETIASVTITVDAGAGGFAVGEFGLSETPNQAIPALNWVGLVVLAGLLALGGLIVLRRL
ncbi:MAG TPA: hypothetical protein VMT19_07185 [Thermoanaerobaculaceae bacterium]|nr:hypothetical protein [Thermoanaerobaculaceae bacterium]